MYQFKMNYLGIIGFVRASRWAAVSDLDQKRPQIRKIHIQRCLIGIWTLVLLGSAVGRLRNLESLSPPDLAFFAQSCWNSCHGLGFEQTALEFDSGLLFRSMHLSIVRALWIPFFWVYPRVETLVILQALAVAVGILGAIRLSSSKGTSASSLSLALVLLFPMSPVLATTDVRPLIWMYPAVIWVIVGLREDRPMWTVLAALFALSAREEAPYVLAALIPWGIWERRGGSSWWTVGMLFVLTTVGWLCIRYGWSGAGNIRTTTDHSAVLQSIWSGERPVFRWKQEWEFALPIMIASLPALRCPLLWSPGLLAWLYLVVFSDFEPMAPGNGGLHYLSVVAPFWIGALALGVGRLERSGKLSGFRAQIVWGTALLVAVPQWKQAMTWCTSAFVKPEEGLYSMISMIRDDTGGVLAHPQVAPLLVERPLLRIQGHFQVTPERARQVSNEVDWALLPRRAPSGIEGSSEWALWNAALPEAGLTPVMEKENWILWAR